MAGAVLKKTVAVLVAAFVLLGFAAHGTEGSSPIAWGSKSPTYKAGPRTVGIGIYLLNLGEVDLMAGTFDADFFIYFTSEYRYLLDIMPLEGYFPNCGKGPVIWEVSKLPGRENITSQYRVKSKFFFKVDISQLPFESHTFMIQFEDPHTQLENLEFSFEPEFSGIPKELSFPGFSRADIENWIKVTNYTYPPKGPGAQTYSRFTWYLKMTRPKVNAFIRGLLPPMFILLVVCFNSSIPPKFVNARITVSSSLLVAAVMYHSNLENQSPPTGQLSLADEFMLVTYSLIVLNFIACIAILKLDAIDSRFTLAVSSLSEQLQWTMTPIATSYILIGWKVLLFVAMAAAGVVAMWWARHFWPGGGEKDSGGGWWGASAGDQESDGWARLNDDGIDRVASLELAEAHRVALVSASSLDRERGIVHRNGGGRGPPTDGSGARSPM